MIQLVFLSSNNFNCKIYCTLLTMMTIESAHFLHVYSLIQKIYYNKKTIYQTKLVPRIVPHQHGCRYYMTAIWVYLSNYF